MNVAADQLRALVERIESVEGQIADLNADKSEIYKEAKSNGFDVGALREVIARRRRRGKNADAFDSHTATVDLYLSALDGADLSRVHVHEEGEAA